jgi:phage terminase small subunit
MPSDLTTQDKNPDNLTDLQAAFARAYVQNGNGNASQAARDAGYSESSAAVIGYRLLRDEGVIAYIHQLTLKLLAVHAPVALSTQLKLMVSARSEFVKQKASADILDRTGFKPVDRHQHLVAGSVTVSIDLGD